MHGSCHEDGREKKFYATTTMRCRDVCPSHVPQPEDHGKYSDARTASRRSRQKPAAKEQL